MMSGGVVEHGRLDREVFDKALDAVTTRREAEPGPRDAVLEALPEEVLDPDEGVVWAKRSAQLADRLLKWAKHGLLWALCWVGCGLVVTSAPYAPDESGDLVTLSPQEALDIFVRLATGGLLGHVFAGVLRHAALVSGETAFSAVVDAADWAALEVLCGCLGTSLVSPTSRASLPGAVLRRLRLEPRARHRFVNYFWSLTIAAGLWAVQEFAAVNTIRLWTRRRFADRVDASAAGVAVLRALAASVASGRRRLRDPKLRSASARRTRQRPDLGGRQNFRSLKVALYLGPTFGSVTCKAEAREIGARVFALCRLATRGPNRDRADRRRSVRRDAVFELVFGRAAGPGAPARPAAGGSRPSAAFDELFPPDAEDVGDATFADVFENVFTERRFLAASVSGSKSLVGVVKQAFVFAWFVAAATATLLVWHASIVDAAVLLGSVLLALSWAVGASASRFVAGVAFVLLTDPYDVGDRVLVVDAQAATGDDKGYPLIVMDVGPASTVFVTSYGERLVAANCVLADKAVVNQSRSPTPSLCLHLRLAARTPPHQLKAFAAAMDAYAAAHPRAWRSAYVIVSDVAHERGYVTVSCWFDSASPGGYHDWATLYRDRSDVFQFVHAYVHESNLHYVHPALPVLRVDAREGH